MAAVLQFNLTGGATNTNPNLSLGGVGSDTAIGSDINNLFDNVQSAQARAGLTEYRAIDLCNVGDATATNVLLYISSQYDTSYASISIGLDSGTQLVSTEIVAPASPEITFSQLTSSAKVIVPDIASGSKQRIWIKRVTNADITDYVPCGFSLVAQMASA